MDIVEHECPYFGYGSTLTILKVFYIGQGLATNQFVACLLQLIM